MIVIPEMDFRGSKNDLYESDYFCYFKLGIYLILTLLNSSFSVTIRGEYKESFFSCWEGFDVIVQTAKSFHR